MSRTDTYSCGVQLLSCGKRKKVTSPTVATTEFGKLPGMSPGPFEAFDCVSFWPIVLCSAVMLNMPDSSQFDASKCVVFAIVGCLHWTQSDCFGETKEKTTAFDGNLMRSLVLHQAAQT